MFSAEMIIGQDLTGFHLEMWYQLSVPTGEAGAKVIGYFKDCDIANASGKGKGWFGSDGTVKSAIVLTNDGCTGYLIPSNDVSLSNEDELRAIAVNTALEKLTPAERSLLKLS